MTLGERLRKVSQTRIDYARAQLIEDECARRGMQLKRLSNVERVGPCPVCGGMDRFAINTHKQVFNCRGCGKGGDVIALVRHLDGCGFNDAIEQLFGESSAGFDSVRHAKPQAEDADRQRRQHAKAAWLWSQRRPIEGSIAEMYLRRARAITCPLPPTLAFLPPRKPEHHPALIAAFSMPDEIEPGVLGEPQNVEAVHLTLLRRDGSGKAEVECPKLFIGIPGKMPIMIAPPNDLLGMAITEGIETGLSVHASTGLGVWVAGSASRMPALAEQIPGYIECVTIHQEADLAGELQASKLARSLVKRGMEVRIAEVSP